MVDAPVSAHLEAAEIHRRVVAAGGPALLFTNVPRRRSPPRHQPLRHRAPRRAGFRPPPLRARSVGSSSWPRRCCPRPRRSSGAPATWPARPCASASGAGGPGPVTEVATADVRLDRLPVLTCWPEDGGPFVTLPLVYTEHPDRAGHSNLGMYRLHVHDARTTGMHWQIGKGGGFHYAAAEARGEPLPVTVFLGGPPALILAAIAPLPENLPELMLASLIAGEKLRLCEGPGPHPLVADAEIALVGSVAAAGAPTRGPVRRPLRLLLAAARLPGVRGRAPVPAARRDLPRDGRGQAAAGGLLHRRPAAGAALAALPPGDARGRPTSGRTARRATTRWPRRWSRSATRARPWPRRSASSARASSRSRSSCS